jgi:methylenetetrahydrofolate dehydrogenase (NADP+)/methenyltetrahydrofolate cyclohydrolase
MIKNYPEKLIDGKVISERIFTEIKNKVVELSQQPRLAIVLASNDPSSHKYVEEMKMKKAEALGIGTKLYFYDENITKESLISEIKKFKHNEAFHGVLIQLPFYDHLRESTNIIVNSLDPAKDVDGLTGVQQGNCSHLLRNSIPTAAMEAVLESLNDCFDDNLTWINIIENASNIDSLRGKNILIINNTNLIGKPLASILTTLGATVMIANEFTKDIKNLTLISDIVISATNKANLYDHTYFKDGVILIDVTSNLVNGKVVGDFIYSEELLGKVSKITPVPGGIGPLTIACLLRNLVR